MTAPTPENPPTPPEPRAQLPTSSPGGHPSPLPTMTLLLVSALLAMLGIIVLARADVPALGWTFLAVGILGALCGVVLAVRNVQTSRAIQRRETRAAREPRDPEV